MYYTEDTRENMRFMIIFITSLIAHIVFILLFPTFYEKFEREEIKEEKIRAGLVSLVDDDKKKLAATTKDKEKKEQLVKKEEVKKQEEVKEVKKEEKPEPKPVVKPKVVEDKVEVKEVKKVLPKLTGPVRKERELGATRVNTTNNVSALRETNIADDKVFSETVEERNLNNSEALNINIEDRELKEVEASITTGDFERAKIGEDYVDATSVTDLKTDINTIADIKGTDNETRLPKNVAAATSDVEGGIVEFRKFTSPIYPEEALKNAQSGSVEVEFEIRGARTIFIGVVGKSGYSGIDRAVEQAARTWEFEIKKDGLLASGRVRVKVEFDLKSQI